MSEIEKTEKKPLNLASLNTKQLLGTDIIKNKFKEMMGKRSTQYLTTVLQVINQNEMLAKANPMSVYSAALTAATLDLPVNPNLGFAYILPYNDRKKGAVAQFQLGYKGFIQLAQRSGQFKTISATPIYEGQVVSNNPLTGVVFDFECECDKTKVIGYASYFELLNGFQKTFYMTAEEMETHAKKFSQTYKRGFGIWKDDFNSMAIKTVLKLILSKYAPLSVEMQSAITKDQAVLNEEGEVENYIDNEEQEVEFSAFDEVEEEKK